LIGWRVSELLSEAARSALSSLLRSVAAVAGLGVLVGALAFTELTTTAGVLDFQRTVEAKGGWVGVLSNPDGTLFARSCDSLAGRSWVVNAGGLRRSGSAELTKAPGTLFQTAIVTSGAPRIWSAQPPRHSDLAEGVVVGEQLAAEVGLSGSSVIAELHDGEVLHVGNVISVENRYPEAARWMLRIAGPVGRIDECWVEFAPRALEAGLAAASMVFGDVSRIDARPLIRLDEFARDPQAELAQRPLANAWLPIGCALASLFWIITWFRRADIGLYRAVGTDTLSLWVLVQLEAVMIYLPTLISGYLWAVLVFALQKESFPGWDQLTVAFRSVASAIALSIVLAPCAAILIGRSQIAIQLKDR